MNRSGLGTKQASAGGAGVGGGSTSDFSASFPDSTRGTAFASLPDPGTTSPLQWQPSMKIGFPDLATKQFLSPSLTAGRGSAALGRGGSAVRFGAFGARSQNSLIQKPVTDLNNDMDPVLQDPLLHPTIDTSLPTSVDQQ